MNQDIYVTHSLTVPLFKAPSSSLRDTLHWFSSTNVPCTVMVKYFNKFLTFTFVAEDGTEHIHSITPIASNASSSEQNEQKIQLSAFTTKFNCITGLCNKDSGCQLYIELLEPSTDDFKRYGKEVCSVLKTTVVVTSLPIELALSNLFTVIDLASFNGASN